MTANGLADKSAVGAINRPLLFVGRPHRSASRADNEYYRPESAMSFKMGHVILSAAKNLAGHPEILSAAKNDMADFDWEYA